MKIKLQIENILLEEAELLSPLKTKDEIVEEALRLHLAFLERLKMIELFGQVTWEGNLNEMRDRKYWLFSRSSISDNEILEKYLILNPIKFVSRKSAWKSYSYYS